MDKNSFLHRFSPKAILLGALVMFALDMLTGIIAFMAFSGDALSIGATQDQIRAVAELAQQNDAYLLSTLVFGTLTTILGGYVSARLARQLPLLNACALGVVALVIGFVLGNSGESPLWLNVMGTITTIPAAIAGGYWGRRARRT